MKQIRYCQVFLLLIFEFSKYGAILNLYWPIQNKGTGEETNETKASKKQDIRQWVFPHKPLAGEACGNRKILTQMFNSLVRI